MSILVYSVYQTHNANHPLRERVRERVREHVRERVFDTENMTCHQVIFLFNGLCLLHLDITCISCFTPFCADETFTLTTQASQKRQNTKYGHYGKVMTSTMKCT